MNILFLNDTQGLGGGEIWTARMTQALEANGHLCAIGAPENGSLHHYASTQLPSFIYTYINSLGFYNRLDAFVRTHHIDIIFCTIISGLETKILNEYCHKTKKAPKIVIKTGLPPAQNFNLQKYGYGLHEAFRGIFVVCKHNRKDFLKHYPRLSSRYIKVLYTGIDRSYFMPHKVQNSQAEAVRKSLNLKPDAPLITNLSRITMVKGQLFLLQAAKEIIKRHANAHILFAGAGSQSEISRLKALVQEWDLEPNISIWGFQNDVRHILTSTDIFVLPSLIEGLPNAVLEAMAMEKACIASNVCGVPELIEDGHNGRLVPPGDVQQLTESICTLIEHPQERLRLAKNAAKKAAEFDIDIRAKELEKYLDRFQKKTTHFLWKAQKSPSPNPRKAVTNSAKEILIAQCEGMGDLVQAFPLLSLIKKAFPKARTTLLIPEERRSLIEHFNFDHVVGIKDKKHIAHVKFDIAFDLNVRHNLCQASGLNVDYLSGFCKTKYEGVQFGYPINRIQPQWKNFVGFLQAVGIYAPSIAWQSITPQIQPKDAQIAKRLLNNPQKKIIMGVTPGGFSSSDKLWPIERFANVLNRVSKHFPILPVLYGHFREVLLTYQLAEHLKVEHINLSNKFARLGVLFALLRATKLHLTNDNGVMHIADLFNVPQIVLFGPTNHHFYGPMGQSSQLLIAPNNNMLDLSEDEVFEACCHKLQKLHG